jgi:hypothetical protein
VLAACGTVYTVPDQALCDAPDGAMHAVTSATDVSTLVVGRWLHCSGPPLLGRGERGIEFSSIGVYFALTADAEGHLSQIVGLEGRWDATQLTETQVQFNWHPDTQTTDYAYLEFEDAPLRFVTTLTDQTVPSVFAQVP